MTDPHDGWTPEVQQEEQPGDPITERPEVNDLIVAYALARTLREEVSAREDELRIVENRAEQALFDGLERLNLRQARHETLGLFSLNDQANAKVNDAAALREWAVIERPELINVNRQSLGKIVRDTLKEGGELPPGVEPTFYRKISWRKAASTASEPTDG